VVPKPVPAGCTASCQRIDLLAGSRWLCLHSAGRPALPDGEAVAPEGQHLRAQKLLRAARAGLRFQLLAYHRASSGLEGLPPCQGCCSPVTPEASPLLYGAFANGARFTKHSSFTSPDSSPKQEPPLTARSTATRVPDSRRCRSVGADGYPDGSLQTREVLQTPADFTRLPPEQVGTHSALGKWTPARSRRFVACRCHRLGAEIVAGALLRGGGWSLWAPPKAALGIRGWERCPTAPEGCHGHRLRGERPLHTSGETGPWMAATHQAVTAQCRGLSKAREAGKSKTTLLAKHVLLPVSLRLLRPCSLFQRISLQLKPQLRPDLKPVPV